MPAGLLIKNTGGSVQIDDTFKNLVFIAKGTTTTTSDFFADRSQFNVPRAGGVSPLIAISHGNGVCSSGYVEPDASGNYNVMGWVSAPPGAVVEYYIFDVPPSAGLSGQGLVIRNTSNEIVFRSDMKPLRVVDIVRFSMPMSITYASGRKYAVIGGKIGGSIAVAPQFPWNGSRQFTHSRVLSNTIYFGEQEVVSNISGAPRGSWVDWSYTDMVIDVTNL